MLREPGSLTPCDGVMLFARIREENGRVRAECWAEKDFPSHHAEERHEVQVFDTIEAARAWIDARSHGRGFDSVQVRADLH